MVSGSPDYYIDINKLLDALVTEVMQITNIRDFMWQPKSLIMNPSFEQDLTGWELVDVDNTVIVDASVSQWMKKSLKFLTSNGVSITQCFSIPLNTDWFTSLVVWVMTDVANKGIFCYLRYTDGTSTGTYLAPAASGVFTRMTLSKAASRYIEAISFITIGDPCTTWIDDIFMVF